MSDDWSWFWASESGRDNILREEVASLGSALSRANASSSRLSSQLATLSGSIETRLRALSAAFDAYVELGDVREQLAGHPDTSAVRREVVAALRALTAGRPAEPVDDRDVEYWLPYAMNAVSAIAAGHPDAELEKAAQALDPEADVFIVAAAGALGHGEAVADRVPPLLVSDGALSPAQVALWTAACHGLYGPVLPAIGTVWQQTLDAADDPQEWTRWVQDQAKAGASGALRWVKDQTGPNWTETRETAEGPAGPEVATAALRVVVTDLVNQGLGDEAALLERARELRRRIEDPTGSADRRPSEAAIANAESESGPTVLDQVRVAFLATDPGTPAHLELTRWLTPGLLAATSGLQAQAEVPPDVRTEVRTSGRAVTVTPAGADPAELDAATRTIRAANEIAPTTQIAATAVAGVLATAALVLAISGRVGVAVFVLILAGIVGGYAFSQYRARRQATQSAEAQVAHLVDNVEQSRTGAIETQARLVALRDESRVVADEIRGQLDTDIEAALR